MTISYQLSKVFRKIRNLVSSDLKSGTSFRKENFINIATAYENLFEFNGCAIPSNSRRIELLGRLLGTPPSEAYYIIHSLFLTNSVAGDVCEFGVAQGETSALIANEILDLNNKTLHLFDSFEGLPSPTNNDTLIDDIFSLGDINAYAGKMKCPIDMVTSRLKSIGFPRQRFIIHQGYVSDILLKPIDLPLNVSFAYVDFDFYEPIKETLDYLHKVTSIGSIIIVDDYDFFSSGVKLAVDEFVSNQNEDQDLYRCIVPDKALGCFAILQRLV